MPRRKRPASSPATPTTPPDHDIGTKLTRLAEMIVDGAMVEGVTLDQRIAAVKAVGGLHLGMLKAAGKLSDDDEASPATNFRELRNGLALVGKG